jgi:hypothetical protein
MRGAVPGSAFARPYVCRGARVTLGSPAEPEEASGRPSWPSLRENHGSHCTTHALAQVPKDPMTEPEENDVEEDCAKKNQGSRKTSSRKTKGLIAKDQKAGQSEQEECAFDNPSRRTPSAWPRPRLTRWTTSFSPVPVRQRVLSVPKRLRPFLHHRPRTAGAVLHILFRALQATLREACPTAPRNAAIGVVSFLHRFGSSLNRMGFLEVVPGIDSPGSLFHPILQAQAVSRLSGSLPASIRPDPPVLYPLYLRYAKPPFHCPSDAALPTQLHEEEGKGRFQAQKCGVGATDAANGRHAGESRQGGAGVNGRRFSFWAKGLKGKWGLSGPEVAPRDLR